jgi:hypothetical protein
MRCANLSVRRWRYRSSGNTKFHRFRETEDTERGERGEWPCFRDDPKDRKKQNIEGTARRLRTDAEGKLRTDCVRG